MQRLSPKPGFEPRQPGFRARAGNFLALSGFPAGGKAEDRAGFSSTWLLLEFSLSDLHSVSDHQSAENDNKF